MLHWANERRDEREGDLNKPSQTKEEKENYELLTCHVKRHTNDALVLVR